MSGGRKAAIVATLVVCGLVMLEVCNQFLFLARYGSFVWSGVEIFNVRGFTQRVEDARYVTAKPNYTYVDKEGWGLKQWTLSTDQWGFRKGTHSTDPNCPSIGFIGASVPFGWGVADSATLPSRLFDLLQQKGDKRCIFNATIPSYSLSQTVARYRLEVSQKFNVQTLFLQVYDPVSQLLALGKDWQPDANWTNFPKYGFKLQASSVAKYIATVAIIENAMQASGVLQARSSFIDVLDPGDTETLARFRQNISDNLERLHQLAKAAGVTHFVVATIAVPRGSETAPWFSAARRVAIAAFNAELLAFTTRHPDVSYADTKAVLDRYPDADVYVDACCHLSERGNQVIADYVAPLL